MTDVLEVDGLTVAFPAAGGERRVVADVGYALPSGATLPTSQLTSEPRGEAGYGADGAPRLSPPEVHSGCRCHVSNDPNERMVP